jgi:phosphotransferase system HPr-like phosphotransfer protein
MVKQVTVSDFTQVKQILNAATGSAADIGVHDTKGSIADAKSILGLMSLDYTKPVLLVSEDVAALEKVYRALAN